MRTLALAAACVAAALTAAPTDASARHHNNFGPVVNQGGFNIDARQQRQQRRIFRGVQDGSLNFVEARRLARFQRRIARLERRLSADGVLSRRDRFRLQEALDAQSARIFRLRNN